MMISSKGRYALRVMIDMAHHYEDGFISLSDISQRQQISLKYLEIIISILNKAGFVDSMRGKTGGYKLKYSPEKYTLRQIINTTEGGINSVNCPSIMGECECEKADLCPTLPVWKKLDSIINDYLESVTLKDLL